MIIPVVAFMLNILLTMRGNWAYVRSSAPILYALTGALGSQIGEFLGVLAQGPFLASVETLRMSKPSSATASEAPHEGLDAKDIIFMIIATFAQAP